MKKEDKDLNFVDEHFKILHGITRLKKELSSVFEQQERYRKAIIESQQKIQKMLEQSIISKKLSKQFEESLELMQNSLQNIPALNDLLLEIQKSSKLFLSPVFEQLKRNFERLPTKAQEALLLLGQHGWYLDLEMTFSDLLQLREAITEGNVEQAEKALIKYFKSKINKIEKSIVKKFPERKKIVNAAFNAHWRKEYELSIPVFLAQTDGICMKITNQYFFMKRDRRPRTAIFIETITSGVFMMSLLSPLTETLPINASESERQEDFEGLNRHIIMHGKSLDYGTEVNGLKAISLINYISQVISKFEDRI